MATIKQPTVAGENDTDMQSDIDTLRTEIDATHKQDDLRDQERFDAIQRQFDDRISALQRQFDERIKAIQESAAASNVAQKEAVSAAQLAAEKAVSAALAAQKENTAAALSASDRAVIKAEISTNERFEGVNKFREQLEFLTRSLMPRAESESQHVAINDKFNVIDGAWTSKFTGLENSLNSKISTNKDALASQMSVINASLSTQITAMEKTISEKINVNSTRLTTIEGKGQGQGIMIAYTALIVGVISSILAIAHFFIK